MVLASASFSSGHTGRLPLIERPQLPVTKWWSQLKYWCTIEPLSPLTLLYCAIFAADARGFSRK